MLNKQKQNQTHTVCDCFGAFQILNMGPQDIILTAIKYTLVANQTT